MKTRQNCATQAKPTARSPVSSASWRDDAGSEPDAASWYNSRLYLRIEPSALTTAGDSRDRRDARMGIVGNGRALGVNNVAAAVEALVARP
jgi:hypothetical protein